MKIKQTCRCGKIYFARAADIARGWGKSCSKRCAAVKRSNREQSGNYKVTEASKRYNSRERDFDLSVGSKLWNEFNEDYSWDAHKHC